jgi:LmbE family N-acetylglucosaminyl deacetylase
MNVDPCQLDLTSYMKLGDTVVFVGMHPDDLDFHAAGLAALLTDIGVEVWYVVVTSGDAAGSVKRREDEQRRSAAAVGVKHVMFLRMKDGKLKRAYFLDKLNRKLEKVLRVLRPAVVVSFCPANLTTVSWAAEHPDHRYGAMALWESVYPDARSPEVVPRWQFWRRFIFKPLPGHRVREMLWFGDDLPLDYAANCFVEVSAVWDRVEAAIRSHASQWDDADTQVEKAKARAMRAAALSGNPQTLFEAYHRREMPEE